MRAPIGGFIGGVALLFAGCYEKAPTPVAAATASAPPPKWMREEKPVEVPPRVRAMLDSVDDPEAAVAPPSPDQVRAELNQAAAATSATLTPSFGATSSASGEWRRLEEEQRERNADYRAKIEGMTVYLASDGMYHSRSCPILTVVVEEVSPTGRRRTYRKFIGIETSLAAVTDARQMAHHCAPPLPKFTY